MCLSCHVVSVETVIKDIPALRQACEKLGYTLTAGQHKWFGSWVDDSPVPRGIFATEEDYQAVLSMTVKDRCEAMTTYLNSSTYNIQVPDDNFQIGLIPTTDGFRLAWDNWHMRLNLNPLVKEYTINTIIHEANRHAHVVTEHQLQDGSTQLRIHIPA